MTGNERSRPMKGLPVLAAALAAALFAWLAAAPAEACGGLFCSGPSSCTGLFCTSAPTQQTGENILWAVEDDGTLTVHIQIQYAGEASAFAWILPLPAVPMSVGVGTDDLFTQLGNATQPTFTFSGERREGVCRPTPACVTPPPGSVDAGRWGRSDAAPATADGGAGGPTIHLRQEVGPYDSVVLSGSSADVVLTWLRDNGFDIPSAADPLIADYVAAEHVFVAVRLLSDRSAGEIQPLVLRYTEGQPCLPIRLTAIAASLDMPITAYFLADAFATPLNYSLIEPTFEEPRLWIRLSYRDYVGRLIDDAGGRAFVTDFAGPTPTLSLTRPDPASITDALDPVDLLRRLQTLGYTGDAQLMALLERFVPVPEGQTASMYYQCLSRGFGTAESCGFTGEMDAAGLADAIREQIVAPRAAAQAMLGRHARLTRLYTTMDPSEMSMDPLFRIDPGLPSVSNAHTATLVHVCSAAYVNGEEPSYVETRGGARAVASPGVRHTSDAEWCTRRGLLPPGTTPPGMEPPPGAAPTSDGMCSVSFGRREGGVGLSLLGGVALLALWRRRARS